MKLIVNYVFNTYRNIDNINKSCLIDLLLDNNIIIFINILQIGFYGRTQLTTTLKTSVRGVTIRIQQLPWTARLYVQMHRIPSVTLPKGDEE